MPKQHITATQTASPDKQSEQHHVAAPGRDGHPAAIVPRARAAPGALTPTDVLALQRTIGNRATAQLLSPLRQAKLKVAPVNDPDEREAEQVAHKVIGQSQTSFLAQSLPASSFEKTSVHRSGNAEIIQRKGVGGAKIAFEKRSNQPHQAILKEGMAVLEAAWKEVSAKRAAAKERIGKDIAEYDKAVKDKNSKTINLLEEQNDRRNQPQLYKTLDETQEKLNKQSGSNLTVQKLLNKAMSSGFQVTSRLPLITHERERTKTLTQDITRLKKAIQQNPKSTGLTQVYYDSLTSQIPDEEDLLKETTPFKNNILSLNNNEIIYRHLNGPIVIADLRKGMDAYALSPEQPSPNQERQVYHKKGMENLTTRDSSPKEYVQDSRGTMTRRYAYVEKNYYQMMEFFMVGHMTGRFQQYMLAGADRKPGIHKFTTDMIKNVPLPPNQAQMSDTQVAVAHQMYGSLPEQRGVSLTSTPRVGVTYANTGGNFRTDDGFKLKIDLARVPDDVLFLNHYAQGGVSDMSPPDYSTLQSHKANPYNYKYKESATHARELFLELIRPEWVVEIEHHAKGGFQNIQGRKSIIPEDPEENLLETAKKAFGGQEYEKGFEVGLTDGQDVSNLTSNPDYQKGKGTGKMVREGYQKGKEVQQRKGYCNASVAFNEIMEDSTIQDKMSPYHIGYAQGRTGQPMVQSALEFRTLLNTEMEFKNTTGMGGAVALAHDSNKLIIKRSVPHQTGGYRTNIVTIPFEELLTAKIEFEVEDSNVEITIKKDSGDYTLDLPEKDATHFLQSLEKYLLHNPRQLTTGPAKGGVSHTLFLDTKNLKLEKQSKNSLGVQKLNNHKIPLETITKVEFEWDDDDIVVIISHGSNIYEMKLEPAEAVKVRTFLLQNKLSSEIVKEIPGKG